MEVHNQYDIYVGTIRGVLAHTQCKPGHSANFKFERDDRSVEITALEWNSNENEILLGYKNGKVQMYNVQLEKYFKIIPKLERGSVIGIGPLSDSVIYVLSNGYCNVWSKNQMHSFSFNLTDKSVLECMAQNKLKQNLIGVGGIQQDLQLWDINSEKCIYKAKALAHDELNLAVATSIKHITFSAKEELVTCVTREGHVLLYDQRAQRRPIAKFIEPKASYTTIADSYRERQYVVGTTKGYIQLVDMRAPSKCIKTYKSFTGSVTSIVCDTISPTIISTSLDRYLRIHNLETKELLYKEYMKQSLTKLIVRPNIKEEERDELEKISNEHASTKDQEYDDIFENMEVITESGTVKSKKRRSKASNKSHKKKTRTVLS